MDKLSLKTKRIQMILLKAAIIQGSALIILSVIPFLSMLISSISGIEPLKPEYIDCFFHSYPFADNLIILFFIKPYRDYVLKVFRRNSVEELSSKW